MKKTALALLCVVGAAGAVYYSRIPTSDEPVTKLASQQDTSVDTESSRDTFEYFLSGLGEADLSTLKNNFNSYNEEQANAYQLDEELFQRFIDYKAALTNIDSTDIDKLNIEQIRQLMDQLINLQLQFFSPQEQQQLFAEENQLRELALKQLDIQQQAQNSEDATVLWQQEIDLLSPDLQQSYQNASLLSQLQHTMTMDDQERYLAHQELVGTEAANRLETLALERDQFKQTMEKYLEQRKEIQTNNQLNIEEQQSEINTLRNSIFSVNQIRRVQALERIADERLKS